MPDYKISTKSVALVAVFSALSIVIIRIFPGIPIVGVPESSIKFDAAVAPIYGLVVGPYLGFLAALIGGLVTAGSPFSILTSFAPAISAMTAGFLARKTVLPGRIKLPGWVAAAILLGGLIVGWYITPIGLQAPLYPILHIAGFLAVIVTRGWIANLLGKIEVKRGGLRFKPTAVLLGFVVAVSAFMFSKPFIGEEIWILPYFSVPLYVVAEILVLYGIFGKGKTSFIALGFALTICANILSTPLMGVEIPVLQYLSVALYVAAQVAILYGIFGEGRFSLFSSVFVASYCGIIADHMLGNLIFIGVIDIFIPLNFIQDSFLQPLGLPNIPSLFMYMLPISAAERILMTIAATIFGLSLFIALHKTGILQRTRQQGPRQQEDE